jgi:hypothetical protein
MLVDPPVVASSAHFFADDAVSEVVGHSRQAMPCINCCDVGIAMQKWQHEKGYYIYLATMTAMATSTTLATTPATGTAMTMLATKTATSLCNDNEEV